MQRQGPLWISHGQDDGTNGAYGGISNARQRSDRLDTVRVGRFLDTLDRRGDVHRYYSSSHSDRHHDCHRYHPYMRNDRGYLSYEFKKEKPPTSDGDVKNPEDAETWILEMNKSFELHEYKDNMKAEIAISNLKGKVDTRIDDLS